MSLTSEEKQLTMMMLRTVEAVAQERHYVRTHPFSLISFIWLTKDGYENNGSKFDNRLSSRIEFVTFVLEGERLEFCVWAFN